MARELQHIEEIEDQSAQIKELKDINSKLQNDGYI